MNSNNQNINIEEKRKIFLEELDKIEPNILKFDQFSGPGIKRKIQRLINVPNVYIPYVFLNNLAISDQEGFIDIYRDKKTSASSTINKNVLDKKGFTLGNKEKIQSITLDEYVKNHSHPTVIKMDIEGSEKMAIEGGEKFLKSESPIIAIEVWSKEEKGEISMEAVEKLKDLGYRSYFIKLDGTIEEIKESLIENLNFRSFDNFIFKK